MHAEDERLETVLAEIRADEDVGTLTVRAAADARVSALESHLAKCQELRRDHLGSGDGGC